MSSLVHSPKSVSLVIPCFNEQDSIPIVIPRILTCLCELKKNKRIDSYELIVVDDQSTDQSVNLLRACKEVNLFHTYGAPRGYGRALKTGFRQARGQWIGFLDMDNSYRPEDFPLFVEEIHQGKFDFIMGVRSFREKGMSLTRGLGNWFYASMARLLYDSRLRDVCSGYRLFHRNHLERVLNIPEDDLNFSIYLTLETITQNIPIKQIPIKYDKRLGFSKLSVINDGLAFMKVLLNLKKRHIHVFEHHQV